MIHRLDALTRTDGEVIGFCALMLIGVIWCVVWLVRDERASR